MLRVSNISFPGFGIGEFSVNSVAFTIFGVSIAWYALFIVCGMIAAVAYAVIQSRKIGITLDDVLDFALFTIPFGVIGARLYYVFSEIEHYHSIGEVLDIRKGGLAIYGGIIAGTVTVYVVSKIKKINFFAFGDCVAPGVLLAQGIGRWGNFMNGEAYGSITDWFCGMGLQNELTFSDFGTTEMVYVHPTFLYESLWNLLGVLLVYLFAKFIGKKYDGQLILLIFGWYGFGRMFIEGLRTDSLYLFNTDIRVSQALAAVIFIACLAALIFFKIKKPIRELYKKVSVEGKEPSQKTESDLLKKIKSVFSSKKVATEENKEEENEENNK